MGTATWFYNKAQGRTAHPGFILLHGCTPTGFHKSLPLYNPVGVGCLMQPHTQGAFHDPGLCC